MKMNKRTNKNIVPEPEILLILIEFLHYYITSYSLLYYIITPAILLKVGRIEIS